MLTQEQAVEIRVMARRGESVRVIARQLDCSRITVRRYQRDQTAQRYEPRDPRASKLDGYKSSLRERVEQARQTTVDSSHRVAARDTGTRLRGRHQPAQGLAAPLKKVEPEPLV